MEKLETAPSARYFNHTMNTIDLVCDGMAATDLVMHGDLEALQDYYELANQYFNLDMAC